MAEIEFASYECLGIILVAFKNINGVFTLMTIVCRDRDYGSITSLVNNEVTLDWIAHI